MHSVRPESAPPTPHHTMMVFQDELLTDNDSVGGCPSDDDDMMEHSSRGLDDTGPGGKSSRSDSDQEEASKSKQKKDDLAKHETAQINLLRMIVIQLLMIAALGLCVAVQMVAGSAENDQYQQQFDAAAMLVLDTFHAIMTSKMGIVSSLAVTLLAHGRENSSHWPFVTLGNFEQRASTTRKHSGAIYLHINPFVTDEDRYQWEHDYVVGQDAAWM